MIRILGGKFQEDGFDVAEDICHKYFVDESDKYCSERRSRECEDPTYGGQTTMVGGQIFAPPFNGHSIKSNKNKIGTKLSFNYKSLQFHSAIF